MSNTTQPSPQQVAEAFYEALARGEPPEAVAAMFTTDAEWTIPGDTYTVPWIGVRRGRDGVAAFLRDLAALTEPVSFDVQRVLADGDTAVAVGRLATRVNATGRLIESPFAARMTVRDGLIDSYLFLEDAWAVSQAASVPSR